MIERPILFSAPMARAILDGRKTQTRRVVKLRDPSGTYAVHDDDGWPSSMDDCGDWLRDPCPYGVPGDRLVMLSNWATTPDLDEMKPSLLTDSVKVWTEFDGPKPVWAGRTRIGRFMPNRLRRHCDRADVVSVRVERINEISDEDAVREGVLCQDQWPTPIEALGDCPALLRDYGRKARQLFSEVWDECTPKHPWSSNPWVWVVEFKRIAGGAA